MCVCVCGERMFAMNRSHDSNIVQAEVIAACWHFTCAQRFTGTHLSSNGTITQRVSITVKHHTISFEVFSSFAHSWNWQKLISPNQWLRTFKRKPPKCWWPKKKRLNLQMAVDNFHSTNHTNRIQTPNLFIEFDFIDATFEVYQFISLC